MRRNARKNQKKSSVFSQVLSLPTKVVVLFLLFAFLLFLLIYVGSRWYSMSCSRCAIQNDLSSLSSLSENGVQDESKKETNEIQNSSKPSPTTFTMAAIGDVMCHNTQYWDAY